MRYARDEREMCEPFDTAFEMDVEADLPFIPKDFKYVLCNFPGHAYYVWGILEDEELNMLTREEAGEEGLPTPLELRRVLKIVDGAFLNKLFRDNYDEE
jgi:hypothetical protein